MEYNKIFTWIIILCTLFLIGCGEKKTGIIGRIDWVDSVVVIPNSYYETWLNSLETYTRKGIVFGRKVEAEDLRSPNTFIKASNRGKYTLQLPADTYVLCFLKQNLDGELLIQKCARISVILDEMTEVDYTAGGAGQHIVCPDSECIDLQKEEFDKCSEIANKCSDADSCAKIVDSLEVSRELCDGCFGKIINNLGYCYGLIAGKLRDSTICYEIEDESLQRSCLNIFVDSLAYTGTPSLCELTGPDKSWCYYKAAKHTNDTALCAKTGRHYQNCYLSIAQKTRNVSLCRLSGNRDYCYWIIAIKENDESLCESIISTEEKDNCYSKIAYNKGDSSLCEKAGSDKDTCYRWLAEPQSQE